MKMITKNFTETVMEMILKNDTEMIGCLCLKFSQQASFIYLFTDTSGSFQLLPFFQPNSSVTTSRLCDRRVNAHLHFLL